MPFLSAALTVLDGDDDVLMFHPTATRLCQARPQRHMLSSPRKPSVDPYQTCMHLSLSILPCQDALAPTRRDDAFFHHRLHRASELPLWIGSPDLRILPLSRLLLSRFEKNLRWNRPISYCDRSDRVPRSCNYDLRYRSCAGDSDRSTRFSMYTSTQSRQFGDLSTSPSSIFPALP